MERVGRGQPSAAGPEVGQGLPGSDPVGAAARGTRIAAPRVFNIYSATLEQNAHGTQVDSKEPGNESPAGAAPGRRARSPVQAKQKIRRSTAVRAERALLFAGALARRGEQERSTHLRGAAAGTAG